MTALVNDAPRVEQARRRAVWTIGDQVVASAQNFGIGLAVTHSVNLRGTGAFAVAFTLYQLLAAVNRPLNADPLTIGFAASDLATQRPAASSSTGGTVVFGLAVAAATAAVGLVVGAPTGTALIALAIGLPGFLLQDSWRIVFLTSGRPAWAFVNDVVVIVLLVPACVIANRVQPNSAAALIAAWGAATTAGALVGIAEARLLPGVHRALAWWRATLHLGLRMLGENIVASLTVAAGLFAIAAGAGLSELGRVRTAQVSLGAVNSMLIAAMAIIVAEGTRMLASEPQRFPGLIRVVGGASALVCCLAVAFWLATPTQLGRNLIGDGWSDSRSLVLPCGLYLVALAVVFAVSGALRSLRRPGRALRARLIAAPVTIVGGAVGAAVGGAGPAMLGIAAGEWVCVVLTVAEYRSTWRLWQQEPWDVTPTAAPVGQAAAV